MLEEKRKEIDEIDQQLCKLFEQRMKVVQEIGQYKKQHDLPIEDLAREEKMIERNLNYLTEPSLAKYYKEWFKVTIALSKQYQQEERENG